MKQSVMDIFLISIVYFLCFLSAVASNPTNVEEKPVITTYNNEETSQSNEEHLEDLTLAKYQVTENVIDVPDDRPLPGPLAFNYTFKKPLNIATEPNNNEGNDKNVKNNTNNNFDLKRNKLSILHINADFDEQQAIQNNNNINDSNNNTLLKGIKKYFYGIKKEIIKGINNWFHKNENSENY